MHEQSHICLAKKELSTQWFHNNSIMNKQKSAYLFSILRFAL
jgi:hypothetical protein